MTAPATSTVPAPNPLALIYARVSDDPKKRMTSVDDQVRENTEWALDEGWAIGRVIIDDDRSASRFATKEREGFQELLAIIQEPNRPETVLITWEPSRLSRISEQIHQLTDLMAKHNLLWAYDQSVYDLRKTRDKAKVRHDGVDSEKESDQTSDRVTRHMRNAAAQGKPHGRPPYGYRRHFDQDSGEKSWVVDGDEAANVQDMAQRFLSGESLRSIAKGLEAQGIPTPTTKSAKKGWQPDQVRQILMRPALVGKRVHQGKVVADGNWPAILDEVTFARLQAKFADPERKTIRQRERAHLLTGVAKCGVCESPMGFASKVMKSGRERHFYWCRQNHVSRQQEPLEAWVVQNLIEHMRNSNLGQDDPSPELMAVRAERERIDNDLAQLTDLVKTGVLNPLDYASATTALREQRQQLDRRIRVANIPTVAIEMSEAVDPEAYWERLSKTEQGQEQQREILRATLMVKVHPVSKIGSNGFETESIEIIPK